MELVTVLKNTFNVNTPITIDEIRKVCNNYSKIRVAQLINQAVANNELLRFENGIYYLPTKTILGYSNLSSDSVIERKYIKDNENIYGFYTGLSFMNYIGITTQVPNKVEIVTNNESTRVRPVMVGSRNIILRKARVEITKDNYKELQFLELINSLKENEVEKYSQKILEYYKTNIKKDTLKLYIVNYPSKVFKYFYKLGLV